MIAKLNFTRLFSFKQNFILLLLSFFLFSFQLNGATYYVNSATGSDTNNGTSTGTSFKSFHKAYTMAAASGDVINLTGTFDWTASDETGDTSGNGYTLAKNITIIGQSANSTFIQAASTANTSDRRVFTFSANVTFQNLTLRNGKNSSESGGMYASGQVLNFINVAIENNYGTNGGAAFF